MKRVYNFSAGPSVLPEPVLRRAAAEMLSYGGAGMSVMEMSHRSAVFQEIADTAESRVRELMGIPDDYAVLFLQGGASMQFAMVPLNLLPEDGSADYVDTGRWSAKGIDEAERYGRVRVAASSKSEGYTNIPEVQDLDPAAAYVHITPNNTISGTRFTKLPNTGSVPLVADASSCIMSEPVDVSRFGLIYAGAQKNLAPAGLTVVIARKDLLGSCREITPTMLRYSTHLEAGSMFNTPPCWCIYILGLVCDRIRDLGGLDAMGEINRRKAAVLYDFLDASDLYRSPVRREDRSLMNVPFLIGDGSPDAEFLRGAEESGLVNLKGHRSVGGMRASIYNAMPEDGVRALVRYMEQFEKEYADA